MQKKSSRRERRVAPVLGIGIDALSWSEACDQISNWAEAKSSKYVCICNVHSVVTASFDTRFESALHGADMTTPDGAPVAWLMRATGFRGQERINGPDLMWKYLELAASSSEGVFLYGGTDHTLNELREKIGLHFPTLNVKGAYSPPFRVMTDEEDRDVVDMINRSGAATVWVSLGCPKQELWMASHRGRINAVMIGVGAAFDYHAGTIKRAPLWMQRNGLEWLYRFASEPRRLWRRYLITNSVFIVRAIEQIIRYRLLSGNNKKKS